MTLRTAPRPGGFRPRAPDVNRLLDGGPRGRTRPFRIPRSFGSPLEAILRKERRMNEIELLTARFKLLAVRVGKPGDVPH